MRRNWVCRKVRRRLTMNWIEMKWKPSIQRQQRKFMQRSAIQLFLCVVKKVWIFLLNECNGDSDKGRETGKKATKHGNLIVSHSKRTERYVIQCRTNACEILEQHWKTVKSLWWFVLFCLCAPVCHEFWGEINIAVCLRMREWVWITWQFHNREIRTTEGDLVDSSKFITKMKIRNSHQWIFHENRHSIITYFWIRGIFISKYTLNYCVLCAVKQYKK